jgi:preprotein translocase subunit YajC
MTLGFLLLQAGANSGGQSSLPFYLMMIGIMVVFYVFMILPQQRKQKSQLKFREAIKKGDQVVTIGGLHGEVADFEGDAIIIRVDKSVRLKFDRSAISVEMTQKIQKQA